MRWFCLFSLVFSLSYTPTTFAIVSMLKRPITAAEREVYEKNKAAAETAEAKAEPVFEKEVPAEKEAPAEKEVPAKKEAPVKEIKLSAESAKPKSGILKRAGKGLVKLIVGSSKTEIVFSAGLAFITAYLSSKYGATTEVIWGNGVVGFFAPRVVKGVGYGSYYLVKWPVVGGWKLVKGTWWLGKSSIFFTARQVGKVGSGVARVGKATGRVFTRKSKPTGVNVASTLNKGSNKSKNGNIIVRGVKGVANGVKKAARKCANLFSRKNSGAVALKPETPSSGSGSGSSGLKIGDK